MIQSMQVCIIYLHLKWSFPILVYLLWFILNQPHLYAFILFLFFFIFVLSIFIFSTQLPLYTIFYSYICGQGNETSSLRPL